jgi:hypothetical protein
MPVVPSDQGCVNVIRFEIAQLAEGTDDALADLIEHHRDLRIGGWLLGAKPWLAALSTALFIDPLKENHVVMQIHILDIRG